MDIQRFEKLWHKDNPTHYTTQGRCKTFLVEIMKDEYFIRAIGKEIFE